MFNVRDLNPGKSTTQWNLPLYLKDFTPAPPRKELPSKTRSRLVNLRNGIHSIFTEYCGSSTIHGVTYIGSRHRTLWERFWWVLMLMLSIYGCTKLIENIYVKWHLKPVILSFNEKPTSVWEIPFPAITICPEVKYRPDSLNFTHAHNVLFGNETGEMLNEDELQTMLSLLQVCDRMYATDPYQKILKKYRLTENIVRKLKEISPGVTQNLFVQCRISIFPCAELFKETVTDEGICYTFNIISEQEMFDMKAIHTNYDYLDSGIPHSSWVPNEGYKPGTPLKTHPSRVYGSGFEAGLYMQLRFPKSFDEYHCREAQGFKILLHSPAEYPVISRKFIRLTFNHEITMAIKPELTLTSSTLRNYDPSTRQCFYSHERKLQFFDMYNQANCVLECLTNHTLKLCGCVRFSMPYTPGTKVCESYQLKCAIEAENDIQLIAALEGLKKRSKKNKNHCNCLPECHSIEYSPELTQTKYDYAKSFQLRYGGKVPEDILADVTHNNFAKLAIYFKNGQYMAQKRSELFGWTDFIANCGGVLGLCMGFSLLSLAELVYFCLIRPILLLRERVTHQDDVPANGNGTLVQVRPVLNLGN